MAGLPRRTNQRRAEAVSKRMKRVCLIHRPGANSGGDWVALQAYAEALQIQGWQYALRPADRIGDLSGFDYAHLWAACSPDWGLNAAIEVKRQGKPLIITPFWWSRDERQAFYGRAGQDLTAGYTPGVAETLKRADVLFTVTESEARQCWELAPNVKAWIVPMGTEARLGLVAQPVENFVLSIGRIEPHKNQLTLAKVCKMLGYKLILFGKVVHRQYADMILSLGHPIYQAADLSETMKWKLLSHCRVHALPSFFENPGLVHGEALALGIPAVMGGHGCETEFYKENGIYCDPTQITDVARALKVGWERQRQAPAKLPTWIDAANRAIEWMEAHEC